MTPKEKLLSKETYFQPKDMTEISLELIRQSKEKLDLLRNDLDFIPHALEKLENHVNYKLIPMIQTFFEYFCPEAESFEKIYTLLKTFDFPNLRIQDCELVIDGKSLKDWLKENTKSV